MPTTIIASSLPTTTSLDAAQPASQPEFFRYIGVGFSIITAFCMAMTFVAYALA